MLCKSKHKKFKRLKRIVFVFVIISVCITVLFEMQAIPFTSKCVKKQAKTISTKIIADKIAEVQNKSGYTYSDLAIVRYADNGNVKAIISNSVKINKLKSDITKAVQSELDKQKLYKFKLPLGSFTNITLFSTWGPDVEISFVLTGSVNCRLKNTFESGGVNQTIHHIKLIVTTDIITISPEYSQHNVFTTDYEIAQTVIVGETPSTFADIVR